MRLYKVTYTHKETRERHCAFVGSKAEAASYRADIRSTGLHLPSSLVTDEVNIPSGKTAMLDFINKVAAGQNRLARVINKVAAGQA